MATAQPATNPPSAATYAPSAAIPSAATYAPSAATYAPSTTKDPNSPVSVTTTHTNIHERFTKELTVDCSYDYTHTSEFSAVISLILSKTNTPSSSYFAEIATITQLTPHTVDVRDDLGAKVTGHLVVGGEASITYQWLYPATKVEGNYRCTAFGMDKLGHPISATAATVINERDVDLQMILEKLKNMEIAQDTIITDLNKTNSHLAHIKNNLNDSVSAVFINATVFRGHTYIISRDMLNNVGVFQGLCQACQGYLVELSDQPEWDFLVSFQKSNNVNNLQWAVGITDEGHEGTWTNMHSGTPANYTRWASREPNSGATYNCAYVNTTPQMVDYPCVNTAGVRFICEIDTTNI